MFGVGDDDQVIYGHNSADPAFLIEYARLFPGAAAHPLTVNYRCPVQVVDGARTLLGYNHRRVAKEIHAGASADPAPDGLRVVEHGPDDAPPPWSTWCAPGWPSPRSPRRRSPCSPG